MNKRQAKRAVAEHLGNHAFDVAYLLAAEYSDREDRTRIVEACHEFSEELLKRASIEFPADDRQLSIYDVLMGASS